MRAYHSCALVALLIAAAGPARPQNTGTDACPAIGGTGGSQTDHDGNIVFTFNPPYIMVKGLPGAPFSGQWVSVQSSGANPAQPPNAAPMMYRDAQGRTRLDARMSLPTASAGPQLTSLPEIMDPVAGYRYILDDYHKVAYRTSPCMWPVGSGYNPAAPLPAAAVAKGVTRTTEDLGTQTMSGVTVTGTRYTTTYPPGSYQGNDGPVTTLEEDWRSAQFGLNFLTKNTYPTRTSTQTMTNFTAGDPDPALFQVPDGYRIVDETAAFSITIPQSGPPVNAGPMARNNAVAACPAIGGAAYQVGQAGSVLEFEFRAPFMMPANMTGAPYSGQMTIQNVQTLADGTHLTQPERDRPMTHRDSAGRVRSDSTMTSLAEIDDPVTGYIYILDDFHKIAHRIVPCSRPALPPLVLARQATRGDDLGTQTMSGVTVTGRRVSNQPGRVEENWYSAQFGINFLTRSTTPESVSTQTMTNFTAGEPNPALFQVPADYRIVDETAPFTITIPNHGP